MLRFDPNLRWLFTELPMPERYAAAARAGFAGVEVAFPYDIDPVQMRTMLDDHDLTLVQILAPVDWEGGSRGIAADPARVADCRASVERAVDYASQVGGPMIHVLAGNLDDDADRDRAFATFTENIAFAADRAAEADLTIIVEPVCHARFPAYLYARLSEGARLIDTVGRNNVKLCFDTYHVQMEEGAVTTKLREYFPYVGHLQIGNTPGRNQPGAGELNFDYLFGEIEKLGWNRWIGCEYAPTGPTLASLDWHAPYARRRTAS